MTRDHPHAGDLRPRRPLPRIVQRSIADSVLHAAAPVLLRLRTAVVRRSPAAAASAARGCRRRRATLNRIHGERSRWGRKTAPGASMMPSRWAASASATASSTCGRRAHTNMPSAGSTNSSRPARSKLRTTLSLASSSRSHTRSRGFSRQPPVLAIPHTAVPDRSESASHADRLNEFLRAEVGPYVGLPPARHAANMGHPHGARPKVVSLAPRP